MRLKLILFILLPFFVTAQKDYPDLQWSDNIRDRDMSFEQFVGQSQGYVYILAGKFYHTHPSDLRLVRFDASNLSYVSDEKIPDLKSPGGELEGREIVVNGEGIHLLVHGMERGEGKETVYHRLIGMDGKASGYSEIFTIPVAKAINNHRTKIEFHSSRDSSKTLIYTAPDNPTRELFPEVAVFNKSFKELYRVPLSSPFESNMGYVPVQVEVSNKGDAYLVGYRKKSKTNNPAEDCKTDKYGVIRFDQTGIESHYDLAPLEKKIHDITLKLDVNDQIMLLGLFYTNQRSFKSDNLYVRLDPADLKPLETTFSSFSSDFLGQFDFNPKTKEEFKYSMVTGKRKSTLKGLQRFKYKEVMSWSDGSFTAIAEREHTYHHHQGVYAYFRDEIMIVSFSSDGQINWAKSIDRHEEEYSKFSSHGVHQGPEQVFIVFNDDERNQDRRNNGEPPYRFDVVGGKGKLHTLMASIDKLGNIEYSELANYKNRGALLCTDQYLRLSDEAAFFYFAPDYLGGEHLLKVKF